MHYEQSCSLFARTATARRFTQDYALAQLVYSNVSGQGKKILRIKKNIGDNIVTSLARGSQAHTKSADSACSSYTTEEDRLTGCSFVDIICYWTFSVNIYFIYACFLGISICWRVCRITHKLNALLAKRNLVLFNIII